MFKNYSMTGSGIAVNIATLFVALLSYVGVEVAQNEAVMFVNSVLYIASFAFMLWGQLRRKDVKYGLKRM